MARADVRRVQSALEAQATRHNDAAGTWAVTDATRRPALSDAHAPTGRLQLASRVAALLSEAATRVRAAEEVDEALRELRDTHRRLVGDCNDARAGVLQAGDRLVELQAQVNHSRAALGVTDLAAAHSVRAARGCAAAAPVTNQCTQLLEDLQSEAVGQRARLALVRSERAREAAAAAREASVQEKRERLGATLAELVGAIVEAGAGC